MKDKRPQRVRNVIWPVRRKETLWDQGSLAFDEKGWIIFVSDQTYHGSETYLVFDRRFARLLAKRLVSMLDEWDGKDNNNE